MILLGSTGSIGVNALNIAKRYNLEIEALVAGKNTKLLQEQIDYFHPKYVVIADADDLPNINHPKKRAGEAAILELLEESKSELVINALVGFLGLKPTIKALELNKRIALANKESLVVAGMLLDTSKIVPIDSEHFGLWYLLQERPFERLIITASGGAFRDWEIASFQSAKAGEALKHPNWSMGQKITIDSATMVNKLFEILEAKWLYNTDRIDAIIETKSIIHALIDFKDGSSTAHIAHADMQLPIAYSIFEKIEERIIDSVDLTKIGSLEFRAIDEERYPIWQIKEEVVKNPHKGVIINAANEVAVYSFLEDAIPFSKIHETILWAYEHIDISVNPTIEEIFALDRETRERSVEHLRFWL